MNSLRCRCITLVVLVCVFAGGWTFDAAAQAPTPVCTPSASPQSAVVGAIITLDAGCSGSPTSFRWTQTRGPAVELSTATSASTTFSALSAGTYGFEVVATNAAGTSLPAGVSVNVSAPTAHPPTLNVVAAVAVDSSPDSLAVAEDGRMAAVVDRLPERNPDGSEGPNLRIVDVQTRAVIKAFRVGTRLVSAVIVEDLALAVDDVENAVHVVDMAAGVRTARIGVGGRPSDIAVLSTDKVAVASAATGELSFIQLSSGAAEQRLPVGREPRAIAAHPAARFVYVALGGEDAVSIVDATELPATVVGRVPVERKPGSVTFSPSGSRAIVTNEDSNSITVLDTSTPGRPIVLGTAAVGVQPVRSAFDPRNPSLAYVANQGSTFLTVVDTARIGVAARGVSEDRASLAGVLGVLYTVNPSSDVQFALGQTLMLVLEYANDARLLYVDPANVGAIQPPPSTDPALVASVLPIGRAIVVNGTATAFATVINTGSTMAQGCGIGMPSTIPATLAYQTTNRETNALTGTPNTPVAIAPSAAQTFVFGVRPTELFAETSIALQYRCESSQFATPTTDINTFLLSASDQPTPDIIALAATPSNDGIVRAATNGAAAFAVATINVGVGGEVSASVEARGAATTATALSICRTDSAGRCQQPAASTVSTDLAANEAATFSVFVSGTGVAVPLDPNNSRVFVRFRSPAGASYGATSVAVQVQ